jgi:hypothetical protein
MKIIKKLPGVGVRRLVHALLRRPDSSLWEHGTVNGQPARRHKITRECQFVLWKAGEQGYKEDHWHRYGDGHEKNFRMNVKCAPTGAVEGVVK